MEARVVDNEVTARAFLRQEGKAVIHDSLSTTLERLRTREPNERVNVVTTVFNTRRRARKIVRVFDQEARQTGREVTLSILADQLEPGQIFLDERGFSYKLTWIQSRRLERYELYISGTSHDLWHYYSNIGGRLL